MSEISLLKDASFLKQLDLNNLKTFYVKILILDQEELPLRAIEGRVSQGSLTISGNSAVKRAGNITFVAEEGKNDLTDIDNLLSINKRIKILMGFDNTVDDIHDPVIWFSLGIFVITQPSITHNNGGVNISLQFKDKMCLLNGDCGGKLPTSITFDSYDQIIGSQKGLTSFPAEPNNYTAYQINGKYYVWDSTSGWQESSEDVIGTVVSCPQRMFDIVQTLVCNFGGESIDKIIIDLPLQIKQIVRYTGEDTLYYNSATNQYTLDAEVAAVNPGNWIAYNYNEDCGYVYTDFIYPSTKAGLVSAIGDSVCTILDKLKTALGNYEYFYDTEGRFVFQEIKNYLNTQYDPIQTADRTYNLADGGLILSAENYYMDLSNTSSSIYTFEESSALIASYSNSPSYTNIKNDFHIWGKSQDKTVIHYHVAIKEKPQAPYSTWQVVAEVDENNEYTGKIHLATSSEYGYAYTPTDWRAELYLQGLQKKALQQRPDIYEQELLDLFDDIYDMREQIFKADIVNNPNELQYWFDYILPANLIDISVDAIGSKIYSYQQDKVKRLYTANVPDVIIINNAATTILQSELINKCRDSGQTFTRVTEKVYENLSIGTVGYSAQEVARDLLYQYTDYMSSVSITSVPIYYLDTNNRISIYDRSSGIYGDYVIKSITIPFDARNTMSITASKALNRDG